MTGIKMDWSGRVHCQAIVKLRERWRIFLIVELGPGWEELWLAGDTYVAEGRRDYMAEPASTCFGATAVSVPAGRR